MLRISIPVAVNTDHSVISHFDADARAGSHDVFGVERFKYCRDLMRTQDPLCQFSDCHTGTQSNLSVSLVPRSVLVSIDPITVTVSVMNPIVIPASISFTQTQMFCHFLKRMRWIAFLIRICHFCPELCFFGEIDALLGMNRDSSHWSGARRHRNNNPIPQVGQYPRTNLKTGTRINKTHHNL